MLVTGVGLASRYLPITNHLVMATAAASPYVGILGLLAVAVLAVARRWFLALVATCLTVTALAVQLPLYVGSRTPATDAVELRILTANLREGTADARQLLQSAREQADALSLQELTQAEVDRLSAAGIDEIFPYRWLDARDDADGVGVWSRFPLESARRIPGYTFALVSAQIRLPGVSTDPVVVAVHLVGPWPQPIDDWRRELASFPATLREVADRARGGCVIVAGDFNSTTDMRPFRDLLDDGYRNAAEQSRAGTQRTFPADAPVPPLIAIDHILARDCSGHSLRTVTVPGSDHRGLIATVMVPRTVSAR